MQNGIIRKMLIGTKDQHMACVTSAAISLTANGEFVANAETGALIIYPKHHIKTNNGIEIILHYLKDIKGEWLMRLGKYLSSLTKPELEELKEQLNLSDDELKVFDNLSKDRSKAVIADNCLVCISTIDNRIKAINKKIKRLKGSD